jgi:hypothetical protein
MSSKGIGRRFGFKRTNTNQDPVTLTEVSTNDNGETSGRPFVVGHGDANPVIDDVVQDISETEANQRLKTFRQEHKWDPNMPDDAIEMMDAVTDAHDHKGEAQLVGEVIENSPYPEVNLLYIWKRPMANNLQGPRRRSQLRSRCPGQHSSSMDYRSSLDHRLLEC